MIDINELVSIGIVGVFLSLAVEWIQQKYGVNGGKAKLLTILLSVLVGGIYYAIRETPLWPTIIGVLSAASTVYALFIPKQKKADSFEV